jgi:hypothetical protein
MDRNANNSSVNGDQGFIYCGIVGEFFNFYCSSLRSQLLISGNPAANLMKEKRANSLAGQRPPGKQYWGNGPGFAEGFGALSFVSKEQGHHEYRYRGSIANTRRVTGQRFIPPSRFPDPGEHAPYRK